MARKPKRIVVDTNVWISALVFGGLPSELFKRAIRGGMIIVMSAEIATEITRVMSAKFPKYTNRYDELLNILEDRVVWVQLGNVEISDSRDNDDNRVLETAVIGNAQVVVSGDKDLLDLKSCRSIPITTPSEFLSTE